MAAKHNLLSRFRGSMVGAVVGDCVGAKFEDQWLPYVSWEAISGVLDELKTAASESFMFTDDTAMARSVAQSLIDNGEFVAKDMAERFTKQYLLEPRRGYGAGVTNVFSKLANSQYETSTQLLHINTKYSTKNKFTRAEQIKQENTPFLVRTTFEGDKTEVDIGGLHPYTNVYKPATEQFDGKGSYGNGGAMRISPLALFTHKQKEYEVMRDLCSQITRLTHTHSQAVLGALLQVSAVRLSLGSPPETTADQFMEELIATFKPHDSDNEYTSVLVKMKEVLKTKKSDSQEIVELFGHDVSALASVPTAIFCYLRSKCPIESIPVTKPFERAIVYAISIGGDTDTIASMAGAMAGACYGEEVIPTEWLSACEGVKYAREQADQLYKC